MDLAGFKFPCMLTYFCSLLTVIQPLLNVWFHDTDFMMLTTSMLVKLKVPNEMYDTKSVRIGYSRCELDSSNDTILFLVIAQQTG